jgi:hypothetical protein
MDSNLPPGVSENMIPGNRPEDEADEGFWVAVLTQLEKMNLGNFVNDLAEDSEVWKMVVIVRELAYQAGFNEGRAEGELDAAQKFDPNA